MKIPPAPVLRSFHHLHIAVRGSNFPPRHGLLAVGFRLQQLVSNPKNFRDQSLFGRLLSVSIMEEPVEMVWPHCCSSQSACICTSSSKPGEIDFAFKKVTVVLHRLKIYTLQGTTRSWYIPAFPNNDWAINYTNPRPFTFSAFSGEVFGKIFMKDNALRNLSWLLPFIYWHFSRYTEQV